MLQLQAETIDICRMSKLLVKYKIKVSITHSVITLDGDVSEELLSQLCSQIDINAVQNFKSQEPLYLHKETSLMESEEETPSKMMQNSQKIEKNRKGKKRETEILRNDFQYPLIYPEVKRGEIYLCDFGEPYGSEMGYIRYAIVVQNDIANLHSPITNVIPCTTQTKKKNIPTHLKCCFSSQNVIDYNLKRVSSKENIVLIEQIQTVDKTRLRKYLGTLTPDFMKIIEGKIKISLCLGGKAKSNVGKEKKKTFSKENKIDSKTPQELQNMKMIQDQLLALVDMNELKQISQTHFSEEEKAKKILELFGFDFSKNGVQYLQKAIMVSPKNAYFNLETLTKNIAKKERVEQDEIKRLIVARVKERFGFQKSPAIEFIRLVNLFLIKQEDNDEKNNI